MESSLLHVSFFAATPDLGAAVMLPIVGCPFCKCVQNDVQRTIQKAELIFELLTNKLLRYIPNKDETGFKPLEY